MVEESKEKKMKSIIYTSPGEFSYSENSMSIPKPGKGEVLIKVECAVINPSDLYFLSGQYAGKYTYPLTPGGEGSGVVVESGGGFYAWTLIGRRVGFAR